MKQLILFFLSLSSLQINAQIIFQKEYYNGIKPILPQSIIKNDDSSYYLVGSVDTAAIAINQNISGFLNKIDASGNSVWIKHYAIPNTYGVVFNKIIRAKDNNFIVTGSIDYGFGIGPTFVDVFLCKIDNFGNLLWYKSFGDVGSDMGFDIKEETNGDLVLCASYGKEVNLFVYNCFQLIKTTANGDELWNKIYYQNNHLEQFPMKFSKTKDDGFIIVGQITNDNGFSNGYILKTDNSGNVLWTKTIDSELNLELINVFVNEDNITIVGRAFTPSNESKTLLMNIDNFGNINWEKTLHENNLSIFSATQTSDKGYALAGIRLDSSSSSKNTVIKIDNTGNIQSEVTLNTLNNEMIPTDIILSSNNDLLVTGYAVNSSNSMYFAKIHDANHNTTATTSQPSCCYIYPNPVVEALQFDYNDFNIKNIMIIDSRGAVIKSLTSEHFINKRINVESLNKGPYIANFIDDKGKIIGAFRFIKL